MSAGVKYEFKESLLDIQAKAEEEMIRELEAGSYTLEEPLIKYNPYQLNALAAVMLFETDEETAICVRVLGKQPENDFYQSFPRAKRHIIPIVGLYEDYDNQVEVYPWQKYDAKVTHTITTPKLGVQDKVEYMKTTPDYLQDQVMMVSPADADLALAVDSAGDVRMDITVPLTWDVKVLNNGHFMIGTDRLIKMPYFMSGLYEMSPVGKIYKEYRVPRGFHHDMDYLPNGDILALNCNYENGTVEDQLVVIDRKTGFAKRTINFIDFLKPGAAKSGSWSDEDWFHCNAVWYDKETNSVTLSGRHINAMVNFDFDTEELNWIISDPEGWPEEYQKYLFKPVGDGEFEWQYEQHSNLITPMGDVMCLDNHHYGTFDPDKYLDPKDSYTRGVKYRIDTDKMEIEQIWQYGKERGHEFFSPYISNVKYYNEGHYLIHSGGIAYKGNGEPATELGTQAKHGDPGARLESLTVEQLNGEVVLELKIKSNYYRANKMRLYSLEGDNLTMGRGQLLGQLGITPSVDEYDFLTTEASELLPAEIEGRIVDEADMFTFFGKFERGQLIILVLEGEEETKQYFISTSEGDRGAMCTGTFLSDDDRDTRTGITKEGLSGEYKVKVIIDDVKYDTGATINA
ncbi:aryl-sulfate sulfotransferase [Hutsoniella sourekii]